MIFFLIFIIHQAKADGCSCGDWFQEGCYNSTHIMEGRICTPSGCDVQSQYVSDSSCTLPPETHIFFNKYMISMAVVLAISLGFALFVKGEYAWLVFLGSALFFVLCLSIMGFYPKWILILVIIGASAIFAKLVTGLVKGK